MKFARRTKNRHFQGAQSFCAIVIAIFFLLGVESPSHAGVVTQQELQEAAACILARTEQPSQGSSNQPRPEPDKVERPPRETLQLLQNKLKAHPQDLSLLWQLGTTYEVLRDKKGALNTYEKLFSITKETNGRTNVFPYRVHEIATELIMQYQAFNQTARAIQVLEETAKHFPREYSESYLLYRSRFLGHGCCRIGPDLQGALVGDRRSYANCVRRVFVTTQ